MAQWAEEASTDQWVAAASTGQWAVGVFMVVVAAEAVTDNSFNCGYNRTESQSPEGGSALSGDFVLFSPPIRLLQKVSLLR